MMGKYKVSEKIVADESFTIRGLKYRVVTGSRRDPRVVKSRMSLTDARKLKKKYHDQNKVAWIEAILGRKKVYWLIQADGYGGISFSADNPHEALSEFGRYKRIYLQDIKDGTTRHGRVLVEERHEYAGKFKVASRKLWRGSRAKPEGSANKRSKR